MGHYFVLLLQNNLWKAELQVLSSPMGNLGIQLGILIVYNLTPFQFNNLIFFTKKLKVECRQQQLIQLPPQHWAPWHASAKSCEDLPCFPYFETLLQP